MFFSWVLNVRAKANLKCIWLMKMLLKLTFAYWISKIMTNVLMGKGCINKEKKKKGHAPIFVTKVLPAFSAGKGRYRLQEENWDPIKFHLHGLHGCNSGQRMALGGLNPSVMRFMDDANTLESKSSICRSVLKIICK